MEFITLSNGVKMPALGYVTFTMSNEETERCVLEAYKLGKVRAMFPDNTSVSCFNSACALSAKFTISCALRRNNKPSFVKYIL